MSATFKNAKKKLTQHELRKYMNQHKTKQEKTAKVNSPLAKYNEAGQLTCVLCNSVVRSEAVWNVHINSKQHKENVELAKKLKEKTNNFTTATKRSAAEQPEIPTKKIKGILKNSQTKDSDASYTVIPIAPQEKHNKTLDTQEVPKQNDESLPEGFFDDPKLDAKARNLEYRDPVEEEWEKFQKEIKEADYESSAIIADDQEEATTERQIQEIDEQMRNWSRVLTLEKKKVEIISATKTTDMEVEEHDSSNEEELEFDEFLDWRAKKSFR